MKQILLAAFALSAIFLAGTADNFAGGKKKVEAKCPVKGKAIKKNFFVEHNGGKVYFC